jgi:hypothetical protein
MRHSSLVLCIDFGTDSVRALAVDTADGREIGTAFALRGKTMVEAMRLLGVKHVSFNLREGTLNPGEHPYQ